MKNISYRIINQRPTPAQYQVLETMLTYCHTIEESHQELHDASVILTLFHMAWIAVHKEHKTKTISFFKGDEANWDYYPLYQLGDYGRPSNA